MSLLLDTHLLLWTAIAPKKLKQAALNLIGDPQTAVWFSVASIWEIAIKRSKVRADFDVDPRQLRRGLLDNGWRELVVTSEHAVTVAELPPIHSDPFDRMLLAQARVEGFTLLTSDAKLARYPGNVMRV